MWQSRTSRSGRYRPPKVVERFGIWLAHAKLTVVVGSFLDIVATLVSGSLDVVLCLSALEA